MLKGLKDYTEKNQQYAYTAQQKDQFGYISDRANKIGRIAKLAPHLEPGVVQALADANANDSLIAKIGLAAIAVEADKAEKEREDKNKGLLGTIWDKTKVGTRWAASTVQLPFDIANQLQSSFTRPSEVPGKGEKEIFDLRNPFRPGWFAATEVGSMIMEDTKAGEGIFFGGEAARNREKRLQKFAGAIPLTVEAGASENTAFEASPDQIHSVAMQILANKDISYEEALDEANRLIRSNAYMANVYTNTSPLIWTSNTLGVHTPTFEFSDVGSEEYAVAQVMAGLVLGAVSPDPTRGIWRGVKSGIAYARGINYVDDAGNLLGDVRNIAQNADEARFMADTDAMVVLANDFEIAALNSTDEAIELATPQPGVWYHGAKYGPIEGNRLFDIDDPRYPGGEGLLVGPGFYTTESPTIGQTYARRPGATRPITPEEETTLRSIPGAIGDSNLQLGLPESFLGVDDVTGVPTPPSAVYKFIETEDYNPRLINADYPLSAVLPGATAPQASLDEVEQIARLFLNPDEGDSLYRAFFAGDDGLLSILDEMKMGDLTKLKYDSLVDKIYNTPIMRSRLNEGIQFVNRAELNSLYSDLVAANPEIVRSIKFVPPAVVAGRVTDLIENFYETFGRFPESVDEVLGSSLIKTSVDDYLFTPGEDSFEYFRRAKFNEIVEQMVVHSDGNKLIFPSDIAQNLRSHLIYLHISGMRPPVSSNIFKNPDFLEDFRSRQIAGEIYEEIVIPKIDSDFSGRLSGLDFPEEKISVLQRSFLPSDLASGVFMPQQFDIRNPITDLTVSSKLKFLGFDGFEHIGGGTWGAETPHRVRIYFDPMKHLDVADPLTGERLPINEAINKMRESGQLAERAGEIRLQIDEIKTMREAGALPGYGQVVDPAQFNTFFTQSRAGRFAVDQVWKVVEKFDPAGSLRNNAAWYELWKMFKGRIPLETMDEILKTTSKTELLGVLNKKVGFTPGLTNLGDIDFSLSKTVSKLKEVSRVDVLLEKADEFFGPVMSRSPKSKHLNIFGSQREKLQALQDIDAFLETAVRGRVNKGIKGAFVFRSRERLVAKFAQAMMRNDKVALFEASEELKNIIKTRVLAETGDAAQANLAADIWQKNFDQASGRGFFNMSDEGLRTDNGYAAALADNGEYNLMGMEHGGPGLLSELLSSPLELPDVQELRRITSMLGMLTGKQGLQRFIKKSELRTKALQKFGVDLTQKDLDKLGELRVPLRVTEFLMTKVWKNAKKFSLAYGLRNTMEAQARLAFAGKDNVFTHPIDHLLVSTHARIPDDIALGEEFNPLGWSNLGKVHEEAGEGYRTMLGNAYYGSDQGMDMMQSQFRIGEFVVFSKDNPVDWAQAGGYELRQLFNDPVVSRLANGASVDDAMKWLYSDADDAKKALKQIEDTMRNGELFYSSWGEGRAIPIDPTPANVRIRVEKQQAMRLSAKTGGDPELMEVVSKGTIKGEDAFLPNGQPSKALVEYLVENINSDIYPTFYKGRAKAGSPRLKAAENWFDHATKVFFDGLVGRAHNVLDRSPLWRREYTKEVSRLAPLLSKEAAAELKDILMSRVEYYNEMAKAKKLPRTFTLQDYVGRGVDPDELLESLDNAGGWMSRDEMHVLANGLTLDKIENLLFDATARNSVTDAARIVSPFGAAFAEVLKTWVKLTAQNPDKVLNLGRKFEILAGTDQPDTLKNKGIIHKDPVSGQYFYSLPMSRQVATFFNKIVGEDTGSEYSLQAPVKGLNMAFNFTPGFSPVAGFPLGKLLYESPKLRDYAAFFLPYGQPKSPTTPSEYLPGWLSKIVNAFVNDPKSGGVYGDTLSDVIRTEAATGKWDLSDPEQRSAFQRDAEAKAKVLTILRGIGQGLGPASPVIESKIKTQGGDVYASMLTSEFHKLQSEDYDTAVEKFLALYGDEAFVFMAGKTKQVMTGVESSREFAKWELDNAELFDTPFANVAGFFGPKGSEFDWAAYNYQINTGKKERIPALPTQLELAEQIMGLHKYRKIVELAGPNPNEQVRTVLAQQKAILQKEYPGMLALSSYDVEKFKRTLSQLRLATEDPRLKNNETAQALTQYLNLRDVYTTFAKSNNVGWDSPKSAGLRADLRYRAQFLIKETPEFGRLFDRLLLPELDN